MPHPSHRAVFGGLGNPRTRDGIPPINTRRLSLDWMNGVDRLHHVPMRTLLLRFPIPLCPMAAIVTWHFSRPAGVSCGSRMTRYVPSSHVILLLNFYPVTTSSLLIRYETQKICSHRDLHLSRPLHLKAIGDLELSCSEVACAA